MDLGGPDPARKGQLQPLTGHDRLDVGVLPQWPPIGLAQAWTVLFAPLTPAPPGASMATGQKAGRRGPAAPTMGAIPSG
jgi:hypothetical protein